MNAKLTGKNNKTSNSSNFTRNIIITNKNKTAIAPTYTNINNNETNSRFKNDRITVDSKNNRIKNKIEWIGLLEKKRKDAVKTCNIEKV